MCKKPNNIKCCNNCHSCNLMVANNHPDYYNQKPEIGKKIIGIENIRKILNYIYNCSHQEGKKLVLFPSSELLTEEAQNALLKSIEEPPQSTLFLLGCKNSFKLLSTIKSRCLYLSLAVPKEKTSLRWLKLTGNYNLIYNITALRLYAGAPISAQFFLNSKFWKERIIFCNILYNAIKNKNMLLLLKKINNYKYNYTINWLLSFINDSIKFKQNTNIYIINIDKIYLIKIMSKSFKNKVFHKQWQYWISFLKNHDKYNYLNQELMITYQLLNWEKFNIYK